MIAKRSRCIWLEMVQWNDSLKTERCAREKSKSFKGTGSKENAKAPDTLSILDLVQIAGACRAVLRGVQQLEAAGRWAFILEFNMAA